MRHARKHTTTNTQTQRAEQALRCVIATDVCRSVAGQRQASELTLSFLPRNGRVCLHEWPALIRSVVCVHRDTRHSALLTRVCVCLCGGKSAEWVKRRVGGAHLVSPRGSWSPRVVSLTATSFSLENAEEGGVL